MKRLFLIFVFSLAIFGCGEGEKDPTQEKPTGFVNDYADVLSDSEEDKLESKLVGWQKDTTNELAVITVSSLNGKTIEELAVDIGRAWEVGSSEKDNGIIFLIAIEDREFRVEIGDDLQGDLTDGEAFRLIDPVFKSNFKDGKYYEGLDEGTDRLISVLNGERTVAEIAKEDEINWVVIVIIIVIIIVILFLICLIPGGSDVLLAVGAASLGSSGGSSSGGGGFSFGGGGGFSGGGFSGGW